VSGSLDGAYAKLGRAQRQAKALQKEIETAWPPAQPWPVRTEEHREGLEYRLYLYDLPAVDPEWALVLGEILFDLRSALDHLAYELHVRHFRGKVPRKVEGTTLFPIFDTVPDFNSRGRYRIKHLSLRDQRAIRHLQPYVTRDDDLFWTRIWLARLNAWNNTDKHRHLHLVGTGQNASAVPGYPDEFGFRNTPKWGPVESNAYIGSWTFVRRPPETKPHVGAFVNVSLHYGAGSIEVNVLTSALYAHVEAVLERFATRFR